MGGDCTIPSAPFAPLWRVADQFVTRTAHSPTCSVSFLQTGTIKPPLQPVELLWHFQFSSVLLWHLSWEELIIVFLPSLNLMGLGKWCFQYLIIFFSNFWINVSLSPSASESLHNSCNFSCPLIYRSVLPLFSSNTKSCFQQWDERRKHGGKQPIYNLRFRMTLNFSTDLYKLSENNWNSRLGAQKIKIEGKQEEIYGSWKRRRRNKDGTLCCADGGGIVKGAQWRTREWLCCALWAAPGTLGVHSPSPEPAGLWCLHLNRYLTLSCETYVPPNCRVALTSIKEFKLRR